ncbi:universal stress protein [Desulfobacca acetoxidans]|uniref:UspA domain-containing protein n=1 Tax=Desulfobacca acetoxidans (strain ATCC 700848 / DSM 11109 / ASRB2) TaxID=880072 RepID=F2NCJ2_DESAR|nr:universal stress protein [Desulfobacca acetoxidans]AEB09126.1 UspA domain-containing protein [Desulfobacca acetoxidans DSM 11109]HAY21364.1 universal stress protein [Desulfobacterales bacterium]
METLYKEAAKSIAVAVDGSEPSWEAMGRALNMARLLDLPLDVLHVVQLQKMGYFAFIDRHLQEDKESAAQKVFEEAKRRAEKAGVSIRTHLLESSINPAEAVIAFVEESRGVKFLVLGSYGHGFHNRAILGSTTERVIREIARRRIPVPVLVVPAYKSIPEEE